MGRGGKGNEWKGRGEQGREMNGRKRKGRGGKGTREAEGIFMEKKGKVEKGKE